MDTLFCFFGIDSKLGSGLRVCGIPVGSGIFLSERATLCWQDARRVLGLILEAPRDPNNVESGSRRFWHPSTRDTGSDVG